MKLEKSSSPHIFSSITTQNIMIDVIIALLPTTFFGIYYFGNKAFIIVLVCIVTAVLSEFLFNLATKKKQTIFDMSSVVTGLLIALNMPASVDIFIPIIACIFAIIICKMLFGGLGQNFINPALCARCFVQISFPANMNNFIIDADALSSATPLQIVKNGKTVDLFNLFFGFIPGTIGEVSKLAIIIGLLYLLIKKVIKIWVPLFYVLSFTLFIIVFSGRASDTNYVLSQLLSGGMLFGAVFMATDYVTSPTTFLGKILYATFIGFMNAMFRIFSNANESCSYSILLGNLLVPFFDSFTLKKSFGR